MKLRLLAIVAFVVAALTGSVSAQSQLRHCVTELAPIHGKFDPTTANQPLSQTVRSNCFATVAEAVSYATLGQVNLPNTTSLKDGISALEANNARVQKQSLSTSRVRPLVSYSLGIYFADQNLGGSSYTVTSTSISCATGQVYYAYNIANWGSFWDNNIESWKAPAGSNCHTTYFYDGTNIAGAYTAAGTPSQSLGSMNNKASSLAIVP